MKLTKPQIILASTGAVIVGSAIFFGLTKTGKGLIKKWFGKEEPEAITETTPAASISNAPADTSQPLPQTPPKVDIPKNTGIVPPQKPRSKNIYAKKALTAVYDLNVLTDKTINAPIRLAGNSELLGTYVKTSKSFWGNKYTVVDAGNGVLRAIHAENTTLKS